MTEEEIKKEITETEGMINYYSIKRITKPWCDDPKLVDRYDIFIKDYTKEVNELKKLLK